MKADVALGGPGEPLANTLAAKARIARVVVKVFMVNRLMKLYAATVGWQPLCKNASMIGLSTRPLVGLKRSAQDASQFVVTEIRRVGFHAASLSGFGNEIRKIIFRNAVCGEARDV